MRKRLAIAVGLAVLLAAGIYLAFRTSRVYPVRAAFAGSYTYNLLFKSATWLIPFSAIAGFFFGTLPANRKKAEVVNGMVERHDLVAFFEHWTHALSTLVLLASGLMLGALFVPRLVRDPAAVGFAMNVHFIGVVIFLFGIAYYLTQAWLNDSMEEHMPQPGDMEDALADYRAKMGQGQAPQEGKYFASERLSYPGWIVLVGGIILTGSIKVAAHVFNLPAPFMGVVTFLHDLAALGTLAYLGIHIVAAAVMPWSWPLLRSMLTGYVTEEYVRKNHAKWYQELLTGQKEGARVHVTQGAAKHVGS